MKKIVAVLVAVVFMFVLVAGVVHAVTSMDDKAKSTATDQKENCCQNKSAEAKAECCKDKAACKDQSACKDKQAGECSMHKAQAKDQAKCAPKEGACPSSCPAKAACEKK